MENIEERRTENVRQEAKLPSIERQWEQDN
jgi:hypothetical protein